MNARIIGVSAAAAMVVAITGCTASYKNVKTGGTDLAAGGQLDSSAAVYIALPKDGAYGAKAYAGSGRTVASAIAQALSQKARRVDVAEAEQTRDQTLSEAKRLGARYAVIPVIAHWEQRATEWSGRPSRMSLDMSVYDADTGTKIDARSITARSRIVSFTSTSPDSLLTSPLKAYAQQLYGAGTRE
ncbi:DUF4823 domain-containing protein [Cupriavidus plantarum]|uniref:DUF4823 domain-containing protein n=1 Tax=Cupriavidus plantarum TaxID=942865 RepID=UPI001B057D54|nr:DUF4823 domain-containing protein [Cupriavidus plantarum]CAG2151176.1 hypothetical protein LMG26296_04905 [Cupriavidus plantarum]SMR65889.1 protein of unknown function [Cupriavidus plantarum]